MNDERDTGGKFREGHAGGPGRPPRAREAARLEILNEVVTADDWRKICEVALTDAIHADEGKDREKGRRFIADYLIGKPRQTINVTSDADAWVDSYEDKTDEELRAAAAGRPVAGDVASGGPAGPHARSGRADSGHPSTPPKRKRKAGTRTPAPD